MGCRVSSFARNMLKHVMEVAPEVPIGALYNPSTGPVNPEDPAQGANFRQHPPDFASWFQDHNVVGDSVNLRVEAVSEEAISEIKRCGKQAMVWFPCVPQLGFEDSLATYSWLLAMGVDVLCVNRPD